MHEKALQEPLASFPVKQAQAPALEFTAVYEELFPFVWRLARRLGVDEGAVDDVCQEVFVTVHRRLPTFEGRSSAKTWVFGILHNVVLMHRRGRARKNPLQRVDPESLVDPAPDPHESASERQAVRIAHALLSELDHDKRTALVLVELEGMSVPEVAEAIAVNVNTVHARLRAARAEFAAAVARFQAKERRRMR